MGDLVAAMRVREEEIERNKCLVTLLYPVLMLVRDLTAVVTE